jgi:hypothetical protein
MSRAEMLTRRSDGPLLTTEKNKLAVWPFCRLEPSGAPRTNTFWMESLPAWAVAASVGGWKPSVGASLPASQPASTGSSATADISSSLRSGL